MRQIGTLGNEVDAERFVAFLITTGIIGHAEEDGGGWAIWVRDENQIADARQTLVEFKAAPQSARYQGAEQKAAELLRKEAEAREQARKNVVDIRGSWKSPGGGGGGAPRKRPLVITIIVMCIVVFLLTDAGNPQTIAYGRSLVANTLLFVSPTHQFEPTTPRWNDQSVANLLIDIRRGEIWRFITPIFIHFGVMHVAFNLIMFFQLGSLVEDRRGTARVALIILSSAVISNTVQCLMPATAGGGWLAGGMSGVLYALFGYAWMKSRFQPNLGIQISPSTVTILIGWMLLGMSGILGTMGLGIANWAHGMGFAVGIAIGYFPILAGTSE